MTTSRSSTLSARATTAFVILAAALVVSAGVALAAVGDITSYPTPSTNSGPVGIAPGPDGNLWFTEPSANKVAKVTTSGVITEYAIPGAVGNFPFYITAGPDGALWFTEEGADRVGKVATSGAVTDDPIPSFGSFGPAGITAGPDGNLWFTEVGANQVAKVFTSGVFTEYPVPTANSNPWDIA